MTVKGLFLTPGAGSSREHSSLVALEAAFAPIPVERWDFPYRRAGRKAPDRAPVLIESVREGVRALEARAKAESAELVIGGRSMGGRMCTMAVAEGLPVAGLVLISYPLHPPGKPDQLRTAHFPSIDVPCLFISGDRDSFGTPDELKKATAAIAGRVTHEWIPGGRHELKNADAAIVDAVTAWVRRL